MWSSMSSSHDSSCVCSAVSTEKNKNMRLDRKCLLASLAFD
jgi:hypothetical protein